jgi:tetratricopeptide (TPR) repeat protein
VSDLVERAEAALRRLDGATALVIYEEWVNGASDDQVRAGRVRALWLLRRWAEAREASAELTDMYPESAHAAIARGVIALGQPDEPGIIGVTCGTALRDDREAVAAFTEAVRAAPASSAAFAGLSTALRMAGRSAEAAALLDKWTGTPDPPNDILLARAALEIDRDHLDLARIELDRAIAADRDDYRAAAVRISLDMQEGVRLATARERITRLLADAGNPIPNLLELRGWIVKTHAATFVGAERERMLDEANAAFAESIRVHPAPGAFSGHAAVAEARGNLTAAIRYVRHGLALEPLSPQLNLQLARLELTGSTGADPIERYRGVFDLDSRYLDARIALAYELNRQLRTTEARHLMSGLIDELPDHREVIRANAWFDVDEGHLEHALAGFRRLRRADIDAVVGEIRALRMLGAIEQAEALCEQVIAQPPAGPLITVRREHAFCAMHERRYHHAGERAQVVLDEDENDAECESIKGVVEKRTRRRWWRQGTDGNWDDRTFEVARTSRSRARLRDEMIPERVRERTLGQLRALEWELARLRVDEEKADVRRTVRATVLVSLYGALAFAALVASPWWVSELLAYQQLTWWRWLLLSATGVVVGTWYFDRTAGLPSRAALVWGAFGAGAALYLWWQGWQVGGFTELLVLTGFVLPGLLVSIGTLVWYLSILGGHAPGRIDDLDIVRSRLRRGRWRRRHATLRRRHPRAYMQLDLEELATLLADENAMASAGARERCARLFESVAAAADHLIRRARTESAEDESRPDPWLFQPRPFWIRAARLRPLGGIPDALLEQGLNHCAAGVVAKLREYKRRVLLPEDETWASLRQEVIDFAVIASERRWGSLPHATPEKVSRQLRARIAMGLRIGLIASVGPLALVAYQVIPGTRPPVPDLVAFALWVVWPLLTVLVRVDPDLATKLDVFERWLPGPGRAGSADHGRTTPQRPPGPDHSG